MSKEGCRGLGVGCWVPRIRLLVGKSRQLIPDTPHPRPNTLFSVYFLHAEKSEVENCKSWSDPDELRSEARSQFEESNRAHWRSCKKRCADCLPPGTFSLAVFLPDRRHRAF